MEAQAFPRLAMRFDKTVMSNAANTCLEYLIWHLQNHWQHALTKGIEQVEKITGHPVLEIPEMNQLLEQFRQEQQQNTDSE